MTDQPNLIEMRGVSKHFGDFQALEDVTLDVKLGERVVICGPSGSGKSTLIRCINRLEAHELGEIVVDGVTLTQSQDSLDKIRGTVGMVFQQFNLFPHLTVLENLTLGPRRVLGLSEDEAKARAMLYLKRVQIPDQADKLPRQLSGGQQQRVALARALAPKPAVILLDEPYAGLDSRLRERIRDQMLHVLKASNAAALMVTHDAEEAMFMSDRIVVLRDGHVVQTGRPVNLYCQPSSAFVAEFFGEVNRIEGIVAKDKVVTALGEFSAPKTLSDGSAASVVIRHEALLIDAGNDGVVGEVMESRLLGRASLIHLSVPTGRDVLHLHARIPGLNSIEVGSQVRVRVDPAQAFVFAAGNGAE